MCGTALAAPSVRSRAITWTTAAEPEAVPRTASSLGYRHRHRHQEQCLGGTMVATNGRATGGATGGGFH